MRFNTYINIHFSDNQFMLTLTFGVYCLLGWMRGGGRGVGVFLMSKHSKCLSMLLFLSLCDVILAEWIVSIQHVHSYHNIIFPFSTTPFLYIMSQKFSFLFITDHCLMLNWLSKSSRYQFAWRNPFAHAKYPPNRTRHVRNQSILFMHLAQPRILRTVEVKHAITLMCFVDVVLGEYCHCVFPWEVYHASVGERWLEGRVIKMMASQMESSVPLDIGHTSK